MDGYREAEFLASAYYNLSKIDPSGQERALLWLRSRLAEDGRTKEAAKAVALVPGIEPSMWRGFDPDSPGSYDEADTIGEILADWTTDGVVFEIVGLAVVKQVFCVCVRVGDEDGSDWEHEQFPTLAEAEAYLASMKAEAEKPQP